MVISFVFLALLCVAAGLDTSIFSLGARRTTEDDNFCPHQTVERLLYNVDIEIEGISEGCGDDDLSNIGAILQKVVDDVGNEIPEYENERMETMVCPLPIKPSATRRGLLFDMSNRELRTTGGRYIYRGGGKCQRCRQSNNDVRFLQSIEATCLNADNALFGANLTNVAETVVEAVGDALLDLEEIALECPNLRSGKTLVMWATEILNKCEAANELARDEVETARELCQQTKLPSSGAEYQSRLQQASEAFDTAVGEVNKVRKFYFEMRDHLKTIDVCNQPIEAPADNLLTVEGQSVVADMAAYSVEMSAAAVEKATEAFLELSEYVIECGDSIAGAQAIYDGASENLVASQQAEEQAAKKARKCRTRLRQARASKTEQVIKQRAMMAQQFANEAFLAAESAQKSYFAIRDELERQYSVTPTLSPSSALTTNTKPEGDQRASGQEPIGEETPLKQWLVKFMRMLYDRIPTALKEFSGSETCTLGGVVIHIVIEALERPEEEMFLVTEEVCIMQEEV